MFGYITIMLKKTDLEFVCDACWCCIVGVLHYIMYSSGTKSLHLLDPFLHFA